MFYSRNFQVRIPSTWYLDVKGYNDGTGYMFGVISQSVIGFGLLELALRDARVALVYFGTRLPHGPMRRVAEHGRPAL